MKESRNNNDKRSTPTTKEIEDLISEFNRLTHRFNKVTEALQDFGRLDGEGRVTKKEAQEETNKKEKQLKIGDRVEVRNNYRGRRGTKGVITKITPSQAYIKPDNGNKTFRSYKQNLRRIN
jgi:dsDNA-specific endonuclease/ATPase MutS2